MARNQESRDTSKAMPDPQALLGLQRMMAQQAAQVLEAAGEYAATVGRAWTEIMNSQLGEYAQLPKQFGKAHTQFMSQAFDQYEQSIEKAQEISQQAGETLTENARKVAGGRQRESDHSSEEGVMTGNGHNPGDGHRGRDKQAGQVK